MQRIENMPKAKQYLTDNLQRIRTEMGLTPSGFERKYGISASAIRRIEAGGEPKLLTTLNLFEALQLEEPCK